MHPSVLKSTNYYSNWGWIFKMFLYHWYTMPTFLACPPECSSTWYHALPRSLVCYSMVSKFWNILFMQEVTMINTLILHCKYMKPNNPGSKLRIVVSEMSCCRSKIMPSLMIQSSTKSLWITLKMICFSLSRLLSSNSCILGQTLPLGIGQDIINFDDNNIKDNDYMHFPTDANESQIRYKTLLTVLLSANNATMSGTYSMALWWMQNRLLLMSWNILIQLFPMQNKKSFSRSNYQVRRNIMFQSVCLLASIRKPMELSITILINDNKMILLFIFLFIFVFVSYCCLLFLLG